MQPLWRNVVSTEIDAGAGLWMLAHEYIAGPRMLKFTILDRDEKGSDIPAVWKPTEQQTCDANGILSHAVEADFLLTSAHFGSLISKIGGSNADVPDISAPSVPYGTKKVFTVGTFCIVTLSITESGPIFFAMNDKPGCIRNHSGRLRIHIDEAAQ